MAGKSYMIGGVPCVIHHNPSKEALKMMREGQSLRGSFSKERAADKAIEYARWLGQRDGSKLPQAWGEAEFDGWRSSGRVKAVRFGGVRVAIPNWDFEQPAPVDLAAAPALKLAA